MPLFRNASIRRQLTLVVLCTSFLGLGIVSAIFELYERASFRASLTAELSTLADTVGANSAASLTFYDRKSAEDVLAGLGSEHHILAACLYNSHGQAFAEYRRAGVSLNLRIPFSQEEGTQFARDSVTLRRGIFVSGEKVGSIAIVSDLAELQTKMRQYMEISALALIFSVFVTVFIASRLLRLITEPILQLAEVAGRVSSEENYALRAIPQSTDEVGKLIQTFNGMLERIQERDEKLKFAKDVLEDRVQARTMELQLEVEQRKQTEKRLQASLKELEDFKFALDQHCRVSRTNPEGIITFVNEKFCAVSKYNPEEMIGKTHQVVNSGLHPREFFGELWKTIKSGRCWKGEVQNRAKDGTIYWSDTTIVPFSDSEGRQIQYIAIRSDITALKRIEEELRLEVAERIRAEEALSAERKVLRALIDNVPDYMYVKDAECRFLVANVAVARQMGAQAPEELLGKTDFDFYPGELAATFFEDAQRVIRSGQAEINREESGLDTQGNVSQVLTTQVPLRDKDGQVIGLVGIGHDITHLKKIQAEMQKARELAEASSRAAQERNEVVKLLLDSTAEAIYGIDLHGNCTMCNKASERMLGYGEQELLGKNMHELLHHTRADGTPYPMQECRIFKAFLSGQGSHVDDEVLWRKDGTSFSVEYWSFPIRRGEQVLGSVVTFIDITERKETESRLVKLKETAEAASQAKSEFLANMSHEIRTPLNGIMGMTDLALETQLTREQKEYLETVKVSADSLVTVINDILDFSKIEAGKIDLETADFDLRDTLELALKTLAVRADEKGLELLCEVAPEVPEVVRGDATRLRQVVLNLIGNAIKFTNEGEVAVKVQNQANEGSELTLQFTVSDTGIGVPAEKLEAIFDPFAQADSSTTRKYGGTGLGLTISARLVQMMEGKIWAESEEGRGSQFHFTVRLGVADQKESKHESTSDLQILCGVRALVVDDNQTNRRILEGMLKRWDMIPVCVAGGEEALAELASAQNAGTPFGLLVTDMHMPMMDGFELVERIRTHPDLSAAVIMMLTSAGHRGDAERCQKLGVSAYLLKPIRHSELREVIARVLGAPRQDGTPPLITRFSLKDEGSRSEALRILVAEDNPVNQRLIVRLLEKRGHRVVLAANGQEALAVLDVEPFDIVFMDVQMPEMDGYEATAAIRTKEKSTGAHQAIIALTAHAMKGDREKCLNAGMDGYLTKPIRPQELDEVLSRHAARTPLTA